MRLTAMNLQLLRGRELLAAGRTGQHPRLFHDSSQRSLEGDYRYRSALLSNAETQIAGRPKRASGLSLRHQSRCQWLFLPPLRDELLPLFAILAERSLLYPLSRSASYFLSFLTLLPCFLAIVSSESCDRILNAR